MFYASPVPAIRQLIYKINFVTSHIYRCFNCKRLGREGGGAISIVMAYISHLCSNFQLPIEALLNDAPRSANYPPGTSVQLGPCEDQGSNRTCIRANEDEIPVYGWVRWSDP